MELLFDTANIEEIKKFSQYYPITGITSNPSILKAEGKFWPPVLKISLRLTRRSWPELRQLPFSRLCCMHVLKWRR